MPHLVCIVPVCPMRATASHRSEQVSQMLFGDVAKIIGLEGDFVQLKYLFDDYEGWCQRSQLAEINASQFGGLPELLSAGKTNEVELNGKLMNIPLGCFLGHIKNNLATWEIFNVQYKGKLIAPGEHFNDAKLLKELALQFLNTAYLWGGRSIYGVDCSGFCQTIFRFIGIPLLRDAYQQASQGEAIGFLQEANLGDLAFFDNDEGKITHVGMLLDQETIIHASGRVRIDAIDHQGIVNSETGLHTHKLRIIKRILPG